MTKNVETFRKLHDNKLPLRLPNAWDAGSARLFESQGASAIATTSAGVAWSLGYLDGRALSVPELIGAVARMARVLKIPLSIDVENGYASETGTVADTVLRLIELGVAGINIEDGSDDPLLTAKKVEAIRAAASKTGADLFINVRTDVFLASLVSQDKAVDETIKRGRGYAAAGADGIFVPGLVRSEDIKSVATNVPLPLNVMAWPGLESAQPLGALGVRRLSAGSSIAQSVWTTAKALGQDFLRDGNSEAVNSAAMSFGAIQELFSKL